MWRATGTFGAKAVEAEENRAAEVPGAVPGMVGATDGREPEGPKGGGAHRLSSCDRDSQHSPPGGTKTALLASIGAAPVPTSHPSLLGATAVGRARPTAILWMAAPPPLMFGRRIAVGEQAEPKGAQNGAHPPATEMGCPPSFGGTKTARMSSVGVAQARTSPPKCLGGAEGGEARPTARLEDGGCAALVVWPSDRRTQGGSALTRWAGSASDQVRLEVPGFSDQEDRSRGPGLAGRAADSGALQRH